MERFRERERLREVFSSLRGKKTTTTAQIVLVGRARRLPAPDDGSAAGRRQQRGSKSTGKTARERRCDAERDAQVFAQFAVTKDRRPRVFRHSPNKIPLERFIFFSKRFLPPSIDRSTTKRRAARSSRTVRRPSRRPASRAPRARRRPTTGRDSRFEVGVLRLG